MVAPAAQLIRQYETPIRPATSGEGRVPAPVSRRDFEGGWSLLLGTARHVLPTVGVVL